jgi:hypothetical protein
MLFCIFCFTVGQFIPIYFTDTGFRGMFYFIVYILLIVTTSRTIFKLIYKTQKNNISTASGKPTQIDPLPPRETDPLPPFQIDPLIPAQIDPLY